MVSNGWFFILPTPHVRRNYENHQCAESFFPDEVTNYFRRQPETHWHMKAVEAWLPKDYSVGTLAMNWTITLNVFAEGRDSVWEDAAIGQPVAYC